jgi:hypothetical protein
MSRWQTQFDSHPFQQFWKQLEPLVSKLENRENAPISEIEELARFKKVYAYLHELIIASDKELVPKVVWQNFQGQCQECVVQLSSFNSNKNIGHLSNANNNLDNLLSYLKPYVADSRSAARASTIAHKKYAEAVSDSLSALSKRTEKITKNIRDRASLADQLIENIKKVDVESKRIEKHLLIGSKDEASVQERIMILDKNAQDFYQRLDKYIDRVFEVEGGKGSYEYKIEKYWTEIDSNHAEINSHLTDVEKEIKPLKEFYSDIFGEEKSPDSNRPAKIGLKDELLIRRQDLSEFKTEQKEKYNALVEEIESLIPGATTAGLATAYSGLKKEAKDSVKTYSKLFYGSIAFLFVISFSFFIKDFSLTSLSIAFLSSEDWMDTIKQSLQRIPFLIPLLWLIIFASKRRSEQHRLEQEYAHKEAIAKSYHAFKKQIEALGEGDQHKALIAKLLDSAIDSIAFNASETLDKKHGDASPIHAGADKFVSSIDNLVKTVRG